MLRKLSFVFQTPIKKIKTFLNNIKMFSKGTFLLLKIIRSVYEMQVSDFKNQLLPKDKYHPNTEHSKILAESECVH